jgi:hypothetical protein
MENIQNKLAPFRNVFAFLENTAFPQVVQFCLQGMLFLNLAIYLYLSSTGMLVQIPLIWSQSYVRL